MNSTLMTLRCKKKGRMEPAVLPQVSTDFQNVHRPIKKFQQLEMVVFLPGFRVDCLPEFDNMIQVL